MTAFIPIASNIGAATIFTTVAANDSLTLLQPYSFITTNVNAINILHANTSLINMTMLMSGGSYGVVINSVNDCDIVNTATGHIAATSGVTGYAAISAFGDNTTLQNAGVMSSVNGTAVLMTGDNLSITNSGRMTGQIGGLSVGGFSYAITNSGTIEAVGGTGSVALYMSGNGATKSLVNTGVIQTVSPVGGAAVQVTTFNPTTISNAGTIRSMAGVALDASTAAGTIHLTNSGIIISSANFTFSVAATALADTIINTGHINRSVGLGDGDDVFDGIGGFVGGTVFGGFGDDVFRVSDALARVFEDDGQGFFDRVESTVSYSLATMGEVEDLTLLGAARDGYGNELGNRMRGNLQANLLAGLVGTDTLTGGAGHDTLQGGSGSDVLRGDAGDDDLQGGQGGDTLEGGDGDDVLRGNAGADSLSGDDGDDVLIGGAGKDMLDGGADADVFLFRFAADSGSGPALRDVVIGFETGLDTVDLRQIDANSTLAGNQAFTFIGAAAFTGAGQLRVTAGVNSIVVGDVNGDGVGDFALQLNGIAVVNVNDVLL